MKSITSFERVIYLRGAMYAIYIEIDDKVRDMFKLGRRCVTGDQMYEEKHYIHSLTFFKLVTINEE